METILLSGGTGLIGRKLSALLAKQGYNIIVLTRSADKSMSDHISYAEWNIKKQTIDIKALQSADYIIHLAGAGVVDKKWTAAYKKEILESRTLSSKLLIDTMRNHPNKVKAIISASAIGWYGPDLNNEKPFTEEDPAAGDFLGQTCLLWEESISAAEQLGIRVCKLRTGIVLSNDGGALPEFEKPLKFGIAGILGSGRQVISWIHIEDLCRMYAYAIENNSMKGSYNAVAPLHVTNKDLILAIARKKRGNFFIPMHVPSFALNILLGKRSIEVLKSTTVSNKKISMAGFTFLYPSIDAALQNLTGKN